MKTTINRNYTKTLISRGWSVANLRERMAGCRKGLIEAKQRGGHAEMTYRNMFVTLYLGYRRDLAHLLSA